MDDPAKVITAVAFFVSAAYSINAIARAVVAHRRAQPELQPGVSPLAEARLARIEQSIEAIALEVERISEGQRFTTRLLSENARALPAAPRREPRHNTPV
jgi:hypothetical protein